MIYHYIYKITHKHGRFYLGRHSTTDLNDGYTGSGVWVSSIKDKTSLKREILEFTDTSSALKRLEEEYIDLHWTDPQCMNRSKGSQGWTSIEASLENKRRVECQTHNFIGGEIAKQTQLKRVAEGLHPWSGNKNPTHSRIRSGTHLWLSEEHKAATSDNQQKRLQTGEHHFLLQGKCPHCGTEGQLTAMKRWHFDKCKKKNNEAKEISTMRR